jgi:hypothetical protein
LVGTIRNPRDVVRVPAIPKILSWKMGVIIALLLRSVSRDTTVLPIKEQISILAGLGVRPIDIALIVGKTPGHVNKELVAIRRDVEKTKCK